jgi:nicotinate-nucleotide--dimethylbenzimidazole phosphoribosyltransferase
MICRIAGIQRKEAPDLHKKGLILMCADNGVTQEGISQTSPRVTFDVATLMGRNKSSVGVMTECCPISIFAVDIGIDADETPEGVLNRRVRRGTGNILTGPAMTSEECLQAISTGMEVAAMAHAAGCGILATGEMGIGNTTTSTALFSAMTGLSPAALTGRGAGLSDEGLARKTRVVEESVSLHLREMGIARAVSPAETLEALRRLGGLDIAGLAGAFIGGASLGVPMVIDGLISAVAALAAERMVPGCRDYMLASHRGREKGTMEALKALELNPVIDADLALGEGTGAVLLFPLLDMALSLFRSGTVFGETDIEAYRRFDS